MDSKKKNSKGTAQPIDKYVGQRLRVRRVLLGLSQEKLAEQTGITFQQIQKYERGANRVSASRLYQFSQLLKVPVSYFFDNAEDGLEQSAANYSYGVSDNDQDDIFPEGDIMQRKETIKLVRSYYAIKDEKVRRDVLKLIRTMGNTTGEDD